MRCLLYGIPTWLDDNKRYCDLPMDADMTLSQLRLAIRRHACADREPFVPELFWFRFVQHPHELRNLDDPARGNAWTIFVLGFGLNDDRWNPPTGVQFVPDDDEEILRVSDLALDDHGTLSVTIQLGREYVRRTMTWHPVRCPPQHAFTYQELTRACWP